MFATTERGPLPPRGKLCRVLLSCCGWAGAAAIVRPSCIIPRSFCSRGESGGR